MKGRRGESRANESSSLTWHSRKPTQGNILLITQSKPTIDSYPPQMERHPIISKTLVSDLLHKEKSHSQGILVPTSCNISTRPLLFSGMQKLSNSLIIEFIETSHLLTWLSKGFWLVPHRYLLFGSFVFIHRYPLEWLGVYNSLMILTYHQLALYVGNCEW